MTTGLADGVHYEAGDYIEILPFSHHHLVETTMKALDLPADATFTIRTDGPTTLPIGTPVSAYEIFGAHVELDHPASIKQIETLGQHYACLKDGKRLASMAQMNTTGSQIPRRPSVLQLLEAFPALSVPISQLLVMLPPVRPRQYPIWSSPLASPLGCTIMWSPIMSPADGDEEGKLCSGYLRSHELGI